MVFAICFILLCFVATLLPRALLGAGWAFWAPFLEHLSCKLPPKVIKNLLKINGCCCLLYFAQFCFHAPSKSSPRGWLGFSGSLFGAIVLQTCPKNIKNLLEINDFAVCFMLLHFASMLLPRALLGAGWAFWVPFLEQLSCNSASMFWLRLLWLPSGSPRPQSAPQL